MKKFEVGKTYSMRSICDYDCVWTYTVIARTAKTVTLTDGRETIKRRISESTSKFTGSESVYPLGTYSMCPVLHAE